LLANIILVPKKNGKIRICIDYHDLNIACPKDEFSLLITDVMIDNMCGFERMTFMDGFSRYNQIKKYPGDEKHTSFRMPLGVYCYTVMPFGLKNAGATYQRAINAIFYEHIRKTVECYVNDIAVKSRDKSDHLADLKRVFDIMRAHQLKMNLTKFFLKVARGKFHGFVVTSKRIHLDLEKICVVQEMQPLRNLKNSEVYRDDWHISRDLYRIFQDTTNPSPLIKKGVSFVWDNACLGAFEDIKEYLVYPPVLVAPVSEKPFLLYV